MIERAANMPIRKQSLPTKDEVMTARDEGFWHRSKP